ncbi:MAG: hypothetical protein FWE43_00265 [Streptococcaceae bacterium]|nr:hypothetical protein [Streptococcaceae bacterium]MCL2680911.1 hypothetical protein [Streptococcaceae bacterium]
MKVLEVDSKSNKSYFVVGEEKIMPVDLSRDNLLKILNDIYDATEEVDIPDLSELDNLKNPVEKEIVEQIIQKISDFKNNVDYIRKDIETQFPEIVS